MNQSRTTDTPLPSPGPEKARSQPLGTVRDDQSCSFCRIVNGSLHSYVVREDEHAVAFLDRAPAAPGHTLVVPRVHARTLLDIDPSAAGELMKRAIAVSHLLQRALRSDGLTMLQTVEPAGWQSVFHVHLHLIPRWNSDGLVLPWETTRADDDALAKMQLKIVGTSQDSAAQR